MKILVCVKQVADMESAFRVEPGSAWIAEKDLAFRMNEYDEYAVEEAVRIKERVGGAADITVLSIGPARAGECIRKALAMGADRGVHVKDDDSARRDPWQIASVIAAFAAGKEFDLILTGMQSQDRGSAQIGVFAAEQLGIPCVTTVVGLTLDGRDAAAARELEGGVKMMVKFTLPALVTCQLGLNQPRYPTLPNIMKAKQKEIVPVPVADLLKEDARVAAESLYRPERTNRGLVIEGDVGEAADKLVAILKEKTTVLR